MVFAFLAYSTPNPIYGEAQLSRVHLQIEDYFFSPTQVQSKQNRESRARTLSLINFTTKINVARDVYGKDNKNFWIVATLSL